MPNKYEISESTFQDKLAYMVFVFPKIFWKLLKVEILKVWQVKVPKYLWLEGAIPFHIWQLLLMI